MQRALFPQQASALCAGLGPDGSALQTLQAEFHISLFRMACGVAQEPRQPESYRGRSPPGEAHRMDDQDLLVERSVLPSPLESSDSCTVVALRAVSVTEVEPDPVATRLPE